MRNSAPLAPALRGHGALAHGAPPSAALAHHSTNQQIAAEILRRAGAVFEVACVSRSPGGAWSIHLKLEEPGP